MRICSATAGCETRSASAAALNEPSSTAAQKHRSCWSDTSSAFGSDKQPTLAWDWPGGDASAVVTPEQRDVVVVGGGIAGLAAAWRLRDREVLLLEAEDRLGGRLRSEPRGEYWMSHGAHLFPGPGSLVAAMLRDCGLETAPVTGSMMGLAVGPALLDRGRVETYPLRLPLPVRDRVAFAVAGLKIQRAVHRRHAARAGG